MMKTRITAAALSGLLLLLAAGCGEDPPENSASAEGTVVFQENDPVAGWLQVVLPGEPVAMEACEDQVWILTGAGVAMGWNGTTGEWSSLDAPGATDIAVSPEGITILTPFGASICRNGEMSQVTFGEARTPVSVTETGFGTVVQFTDGAIDLLEGNTSSEMVEPTGGTPAGEPVFENGLLAWMNTDGTAFIYTREDGLLQEKTLPEGAERVVLSEGCLLAVCDGSTVAESEDGTWAEYCAGEVFPGGMVRSPDGVALEPEGEVIASGLPWEPAALCMSADGTMWSLGPEGVAVWSEIGSVETRLPEADITRLTYRAAGQTGGGSGSGEGVGSTGTSLGGVFRIYESVSSRPDPFTEFPAASRDLRRPIEDLTIEELHLVGITIDPSGGDQAMVEDANGVAYVLREGTVLRNNTRIAEITGNEVIVVQEVTVGSEDDLGGTTSIPTIFSMRLHEEGGL